MSKSPDAEDRCSTLVCTDFAKHKTTVLLQFYLPMNYNNGDTVFFCTQCCSDKPSLHKEHMRRNKYIIKCDRKYWPMKHRLKNNPFRKNNKTECQKYKLPFLATCKQRL